MTDPSAEQEYASVTQTVGLYNSSADRNRVLVSGDDRVEFIQGLCTNNVETLPVGGSFEAAFISPKGKLIADCRITKLDDALLIDAEAGRAAALDDLFSKYRVHEVTEWVDASEDLACFELWGPKAAHSLGEDAIPEGTTRAVAIGEHAVIAVGTVFGVITYVPAAIADETRALLVEFVRGSGGCAVSTVEARRIELGLGRFGTDWDENTNPLEAGLDRAIDYKKGCYVGQEVVAKATYIGRVSRRLVRLDWEGDAVPAGTPLIGGRAPGRVTSSARIPGTSRVVAFGVVRHDATTAGTHHRVGETGPEAAVVSYPYKSKEKPV